MIAEGQVPRAVAAAERLRVVLGEVGIVVPGLGVEPRLWEEPGGAGTVRVVDLGQVLPEAAEQLAGLLEEGVRARRAPLRHRLREVNVRTKQRGAW